MTKTQNSNTQRMKSVTSRNPCMTPTVITKLCPYIQRKGSRKVIVESLSGPVDSISIGIPNISSIRFR